MKRRCILMLAGITVFFAMTMWGRAVLAVDCGEPIPAPRFQVGEKWVSRNEKGGESIWEVIGFEGEQAKIKWATPWFSPDKEGVIYFDADRVIRKAIRPNGDVVTTQGVGRPYDLIGQKELDFPLQVGKKWTFSYRTSGGDVGWRTFRVLSCEETSTSAGKFAAMKIENEISLPRWSGMYHFWYAPAVKSSIKWKFPGGFGPIALDNELVRYEMK